MADDELDSRRQEVDQAKHKERMRQDWDNLIDDLVQDGQDKGLFDNLPGSGKPLNLSTNRFAAGHELANSIMKENDVPPSWIQERSDILENRTTLRAEISRKFEWHRDRFAGGNGAERDRLSLSWDDACRHWQEALIRLNKRIDTYNLKRPSANLEIFKFSLADELKRVHAPRWLK